MLRVLENFGSFHEHVTPIMECQNNCASSKETAQARKVSHDIEDTRFHKIDCVTDKAGKKGSIQKKLKCQS